MRRPISWVLWLALALGPLLLAMGGGGGPSSDTIPRPKEKHAAELSDRQGYVTKATYVSLAGKTYVPLQRGEGTLTIPFDRIERVKVGAEKGANVELTVLVEGGKALEGTVPRGLLATGVTEYGNYQVEVRGLKEVRFTK